MIRIIACICIFFFLLSSTLFAEGYHVDLGVKAGVDIYPISGWNNYKITEPGYVLGIVVVGKASNIVSFQLDLGLNQKVGLFEECDDIFCDPDKFMDNQTIVHLDFYHVEFKMNRNFSDIGIPGYKIFGGVGYEIPECTNYTVNTPANAYIHFNEEVYQYLIFGGAIYISPIKCWISLHWHYYFYTGDHGHGYMDKQFSLAPVSYGIVIEYSFTIYKN